MSVAVPSQKNDIVFGEKSETTLMNRIEGLVGQSLSRQGGFNIMDYTNASKTVYVELKTRRIHHNTYPTAIIGKNKIDFCSDPSKEYYFVFSYSDGVFYIKYDAKLFASFEVNSEFYRGERVDCVNRAQCIVLIPTHLLLPIPN
jgi:hypothetical protein